MESASWAWGKNRFFLAWEDVCDIQIRGKVEDFYHNDFLTISIACSLLAKLTTMITSSASCCSKHAIVIIIIMSQRPTLFPAGLCQIKKENLSISTSSENCNCQDCLRVGKILKYWKGVSPLHTDARWWLASFWPIFIVELGYFFLHYGACINHKSWKFHVYPFRNLINSPKQRFL